MWFGSAAKAIHRHLISVPPGTRLLSEVLLSSPILAGDRGIPEEAMGDVGASGSGVGAGAGAARGASDFEFGVDPSLDPELAMVNAFFSPPFRNSQQNH